MVHIRQPIFSILTASVFGILGLMYSLDAVHGTVVFMGGAELPIGATWALVGILFLMAYFALVHMKD